MSDVRLTVRSAVAPLLGEPRISSTMTSQLVAGEVVHELTRDGDWHRVRCVDGYEGWLHTGYLEPYRGDEDTWALSLGCLVREADGITRVFPLGARIAPERQLVAGECLSAADRTVRFPTNALAVAHSAVTLYCGASYLWGGVTPWGCDCSGLVQRIFQLHGVTLPRDARQQAELGVPLASDASTPHAAADLLFFSDRDDGRVTHVGIALGDGRMVHSALRRGGVAIERMDDADAYVARLRAQYVGVRRML